MLARIQIKHYCKVSPCLHSAAITVDVGGPLSSHPWKEARPWPSCTEPSSSTHPTGTIHSAAEMRFQNGLSTWTLAFLGELGASLLPALVYLRHFFFPFSSKARYLHPAYYFPVLLAVLHWTHMLDNSLLENSDCPSFIPPWCTAHSRSSTNVCQMKKISGSQIK